MATEIENNNENIKESNTVKCYNYDDFSIINLYSTLEVNKDLGENVSKATELQYPNWQEAYKAIITASQKDNSATKYSLVDIDNDGTLELIVIEGQEEAEKKIHFYTYDNNAIIYLGNIPGGDTVLYSTTENYIIGLNGENGSQRAYKIEIKKSIETNTYGDEAEKYEIIATEIENSNENIKESNVVKFYNYNDYQLLDSYIDDENLEEDTSKDDTTAKDSLPDTGYTISFITLIALIVTIGMYIAYKKYSNI